MRRIELLLVLAALGLFVVVFLAVSLAGDEPGQFGVLEREDSPVAWLVSVLFCMTAATAVGLALIPAAAERRTWPLWLLAAGCLVAGLDEAFMGHERLKEVILFGLYSGDIEAMGGVGDLPMLAYPLVGLPVMWPLLRRPPSVWTGRLWLAAMILAGLAVFADVFLDPFTWQAVEELLEVGAAGLLLAGGLAGLADAQVPMQSSR